MSHFKTSYQDFIQNSFSPLVAVMCSPLVEIACKKNNLSFTELVQPFCKLNSEANFRDPSGTNVTLKNFRVNISDVDSRPPQPTMARKFLNESVSSHVYDKTTNTEINGLSLDVPAAVPWFEAWRDTFLQVQFPSDHEFTKHYLACMLVVSSAETNPLDMFVQMGSKLMQMQTISPAKLPKWFSPSVLRYYILLHDNVDGNSPLAESLFETMKTTYGASNVFYLNINSQSSQPTDSHLPDPWTQFLSKQVHLQNNEGDLDKIQNHIEGSMTGSQIEAAQEAGETTPSTPTTTILHPLSPISDAQSNASDKSTVDGVLTNSWSGGGGVSHGACLTAEDLDRLRELINCFCISCLIPHVEHQIQYLTEVISNKKGMSRSLLSATKRWFGSNKPGVPNTPQPNISYTNDSTELQLRRLGDLCFMFGAYTLAFSAYHAAKREFSVDSAWLYYAGALEMAALSLYMQPSDPTRKAHDYAEESIVTYLNSCRMPQFAVRATLFSCECLCGRGLYGEAAKQLIRMTSEDSDLRSALLLEQAAYCFLASPRPPMPRKYAFHLVLAGHRFSKAGQKKHSLRCYQQAYQVYENKKWSLAEDHIHHTIGRQAAALKQLNQAAQAFALLLPRASRQSPAQQATFLREYLNTQQQLSSECGELPTLPLPVLDHDSIQVLLGQPPPPVTNPSIRTYASGISFDTQPEDVLRWNRMEEQLVTAVAVNQPIVFRPTVELLNNNTNNTAHPTTYVGETISVSVSLLNPLHIPVTVANLRLLWNYIPSSGGLCQDNSSEHNDSAAASSLVIPRLSIQPDSSYKVILQVTALEVGELRMTGVLYQLEGESAEDGVGSGAEGVAGRQLLLPRAKLRTVKDQSAGDNALYSADNRLKLNIVKHAPHLRVSFEGLRKEMMSGELSEVKVNLENCGTLPVTRLLSTCSMPEVVSLGRRRGEFMELPLDKPLAPNECTSVTMRVRAPHLKGNHTVHILFYYETDNNKIKPLYRLVRHSWPVLVHDSLQVSVTACRSSRSLEETLNLRLQVLNKSQGHDSVKCVMCVECAALHSPHWQLCDRGLHPAAVPLGPQELAYFLLKVRRKQEPGGEYLSQMLLTEGSSLVPSGDFLPRFTALSESSEQKKVLESVIALQATFIIMWKATMETRGGDMRVAVGQHHVSLTRLGVTDSWPLAPPPPATSSVLRIFGEGAVTDAEAELAAAADSLATRQQLITFSVLGQPAPAHDFTTNSLCIVPVELLLRNCSDCELQVKVEASGVTVSSKGSQVAVQSCEGFRWVGGTRRLLTVAPHAQSRVKLAVAAGAPGAYNLSSHLTVLARRHTDAEYVVQTWCTNATLVVS